MQNENNAIIAGVVHASCFCCADSKLLRMDIKIFESLQLCTNRLSGRRSR